MDAARWPSLQSPCGAWRAVGAWSKWLELDVVGQKPGRPWLTRENERTDRLRTKEVNLPG